MVRLTRVFGHCFGRGVARVVPCVRLMEDDGIMLESVYAAGLCPTSLGGQGGHCLVNSYTRRKVPTIS